MMIADGKIVIGNDGGVYSRPLSDDAEDGNWTDLNATLHDLQFYDARAGQLSDGTTQVVGGLQDNGLDGGRHRVQPSRPSRPAVTAST